ncbi:claudin-20-like [Brachionichthys hirsutus]|uniref:claudin-20-like n=1 Tax=Brachionichthys hirsutus TaxID=412623 RepID=UPI00360491D3
MFSAAVQVLAFALALLGVLGAAAAALLPNWTVRSSAWPSVAAPVSQMRGLWMDCVWYGAGAFSCSVKTSAPASLRATRAAMVLSCVAGPFGLCLASLGLKCTRWGGGHRAKGRTAMAAGGCFVLASFLCSVPASWFTGEVVGAFLTSDLPDSSKDQPGGALCVTFVSAGFLLAGGVVFCCSYPRTRTGRPESPRRRGQERRRCPSPPRLPPKDLKDSYSMQEYV